MNIVPEHDDANGYVYMVSGKPQFKTFIVDSGATHHVVVNKGLTNGSQELTDPIQLGSFDRDTQLEAISKGTVNIRGDDGRVISFQDVLYVPNGSANILSVRKLQKSGIKVTFIEGDNCSVVLEVDGKAWITHSVTESLYIPFKIEQASVNMANWRCILQLVAPVNGLLEFTVQDLLINWSWTWLSN